MPGYFAADWANDIDEMTEPEDQESMFTREGRVEKGARSGVMPQCWRMRDALGRIWIPAPTSAISGADSRTVMEWPAREREMAAPRPPRPAPTIITCVCC